MFKTDNSQSKTPLGYYEKAIEELRCSREELQELKIKLQNAHQKLETSEKQVAETQIDLADMKKAILEAQKELQVIKEDTISNFQDLRSEIKELKRELQITQEKLKNSENRIVDYEKLEQLLKERKWQEADQETYTVIFKICGHRKGRWLVDREIQNISAQDLKIVNNLWVKYSQEKFGFSIQKSIFQANNKDCKQFAYKVGWIANPTKSEWVKHDEYNFTLDAPKGHLPSITRLVGLGYRNVSEKSYRINRINTFLSRC